MLVTDFRIKFILYRIVLGFFQLADIGRIHPMRERALRDLRRTVDYIEERMPDALGLESQRDLIEHCLRSVPPEGHCLEFGVFTGGTIRFIAKRLDGRPIHGFDSFEGLPEAWSGFDLGRHTFDVGGRLPRVPPGVRLHRGWFEQSIPPWLERHPGPIAFVHIDCDLYSSTKTILGLLRDRIVSGTIILFDEYFNYPNWRRHEFRAFREFVDAHAILYTYLAFARQQVAVRIDSIGAPNA